MNPLCGGYSTSEILRVFTKPFLVMGMALRLMMYSLGFTAPISFAMAFTSSMLRSVSVFPS